MKVSLTQNEKLVSKQKLQLKKKFAILFSVLLIFFFTPSIFAQNTIRVNGHITNENGQAVPNASVVVKGSKTGVTSNDNGDFEISASANAVLVISSVGYSTLEVAVSNRTNI